MKRILFVAIIIASLCGAAAAEAPAKNAILFIGDGMGPAEVTAGRIYAVGSTGWLAMDRLPVAGFSRTWASNAFVTDSAAGGTALACGSKTIFGAIGVSDKDFDPSGQSRPLQNLVELARAQGKSVGIITTDLVTGATPACFFAHVARRAQAEDIAGQALDAGLTLLMGGGRTEFHGTDWTDPESGEKGSRKDGKNLVAAMAAKGYHYVESLEQFKKLDPAQPNQKVLALFAAGEMQLDLDRPKDKLGEPALSEMTAFAIALLSKNPKGYFLMVEGAQIDKASHKNDARNMVGDMAALDKAVDAAVERAGAETLIVVTADHETGGVAINGYAPLKDIKGERLLGDLPPKGTGVKKILTFASKDHSAVDVPVMAAGPGSLKFTGHMENHEIAWKIAAAMGMEFKEPANVENRNAVK